MTVDSRRVRSGTAAVYAMWKLAGHSVLRPGIKHVLLMICTYYVIHVWQVEFITGVTSQLAKGSWQGATGPVHEERLCGSNMLVMPKRL